MNNTEDVLRRRLMDSKAKILGAAVGGKSGEFVWATFPTEEASVEFVRWCDQHQYRTQTICFTFSEKPYRVRYRV